jgi:high frequency lysogenization protein
MIQGQPSLLTETANANRIRALLLAAIRSAVLWKQCGGRRWKYLFYRSRMMQECRQLMRSL